ncbi:MAG: hypothetical protein ABI948_04210 [Thermoleophilia bacterium]
MTDDEQKDEQDDEAEETYEKPEVEDLKSDEGPTSTAAGLSNGGPG